MLKLTTKYKHLLTGKTNSTLLIAYKRPQSTAEVCWGGRRQVWELNWKHKPGVESRTARNSRAPFHLPLPSDTHTTNRKHLEHSTWLFNTFYKITVAFQKQPNAPSVVKMSTLSRYRVLEEPFDLQDPYFPPQLHLFMGPWYQNYSKFTSVQLESEHPLKDLNYRMRYPIGNILTVQYRCSVWQTSGGTKMDKKQTALNNKCVRTLVKHFLLIYLVL